MSQILLVAKNTFLEIIRDRILYGLLVFAVLLIAISLVLGQLSFVEQARISANFGFMAIHLSSIIIAIFIGSTLVAKEIEKKTVLTLLVRPMSRLQFLLGKVFGLIYVMLVILIGFTFVQSIIFTSLKVPVGGAFFAGLYGVFLEASLMLCVTVMFSCLSRPILAVTFSSGIFLVGHWLNSLKFFTKNSESVVYRTFGEVVANSFPNLEKFNWRDLIVYNDPVPYENLLYGGGYAFIWIFFFVALANLIIRKKDFV